MFFFPTTTLILENNISFLLEKIEKTELNNFVKRHDSCTVYTLKTQYKADMGPYLKIRDLGWGCLCTEKK